MVDHIQQNREYRQALTAKALVFIAGEELEVTVRNISVTGMLAELDESKLIKNAKDLIKTIKKDPIIDILFEQMDFAGEVKVSRVEHTKGIISMALAFENISYGVSSRVYKRNVYRKRMQGPGYILLNRKRYKFTAINVSVEGLMISVPKRVPVMRGSVNAFIFQKLNLKGKVKVVWFEYEESGNTIIGLQYVKMEKSILAGSLPSFLRSKNK